MNVEPGKVGLTEIVVVVVVVVVAVVVDVSADRRLGPSVDKATRGLVRGWRHTTYGTSLSDKVLRWGGSISGGEFIFLKG